MLVNSAFKVERKIIFLMMLSKYPIYGVALIVRVVKYVVIFSYYQHIATNFLYNKAGHLMKKNVTTKTFTKFNNKIDSPAFCNT